MKNQTLTFFILFILSLIINKAFAQCAQEIMELSYTSCKITYRNCDNSAGFQFVGCTQKYCAYYQYDSNTNSSRCARYDWKIHNQSACALNCCQKHPFGVGFTYDSLTQCKIDDDQKIKEAGIYRFYQTFNNYIKINLFFQFTLNIQQFILLFNNFTFIKFVCEIIAGSVVGGVVAIALIIVLILYIKNKGGCGRCCESCCGGCIQKCGDCCDTCEDSCGKCCNKCKDFFFYNNDDPLPINNQPQNNTTHIIIHHKVVPVYPIGMNMNQQNTNVNLSGYSYGQIPWMDNFTPLVTDNIICQFCMEKYPDSIMHCGHVYHFRCVLNQTFSKVSNQSNDCAKIYEIKKYNTKINLQNEIFYKILNRVQKELNCPVCLQRLQGLMKIICWKCKRKYKEMTMIPGVTNEMEIGRKVGSYECETCYAQ